MHPESPVPLDQGRCLKILGLNIMDIRYIFLNDKGGIGFSGQEKLRPRRHGSAFVETSSDGRGA